MSLTWSDESRWAAKSTEGRQAGFTLIEMLLSVAIIGMLAGMSLPLYASFQTRNDLDITAQSVAGMLRRAQVYTRGVSGDSQWGVRVQNGSATLFKGASYSGRDTPYDEVTTIPTNTTVGGTLNNVDVLFSKVSGAPLTTGDVTLTINANDSRTVTLNAKGMVSY